MKTAVVFFAGNNRKQLAETAKGLQQGLEKQGHQVDLIDGDRDVNVKLTMYEYVCIGATAINFFGGKVKEHIPKFLANSGVVSGKRCFAFTTKTGLRQTKTLRTLMNFMEHEGMYLKNSDVLGNSQEAEEVGKRLHVR
ncbi:MAG: hypothetical protein R6V86_10670 [Spirochaetia bacterium]